jgi:hypothetical protein
MLKQNILMIRSYNLALNYLITNFTEKNVIGMLCIKAYYKTKANTKNNIEMFLGKELMLTQVGLA